MSGVVPVIPRFKFTDALGNPVSLGWVTVYIAGTTTKTNSWQDKALTSLNTNPIHLDVNGECLLWLDPTKTYKLLLQDSSLATITGWPVDNIGGASSANDVAAAALVLSPISAEIVTVAGVAADIPAVAGAATDIPAVAAIASDVPTVAGVAANVTTVADNIVDVNTVATNLDLLIEASATIVSALPGNATRTLAGEEADIIAFDASETNQAYECRKVVAGAGTFGSLASLAQITYGLKYVTNAQGLLQFNGHQLLKKTADFTDAVWLKGSATVTTGQADSSGGTTASLITATGVSTANIRQAVAVNRENFFTAHVIVKNNDAGWMFINTMEGAANLFSYVNLATGAVGTVGAGVSVVVNTTREDGTALPAGWYRVSVLWRTATATSVTMFWGPCNADASTTVTVGKSIFIERASMHYGHRHLPYLPNATTTVPVFDAPYDYSMGFRTLYLEPTTTYTNTFSEDLTQAAWVATNITPAFNATGPSAGACSTLTATGANGTILQTLANAFATQVFTAYIRRKTGTGTVSMTMDNGGTWTDVTAQLNAVTYTRCGIAGGANPVFGFRLGTSGDAIEVAFCLTHNHTQAVAGEVQFRSPRAVWSSSSNKATVGDTFKIPSSVFASGVSSAVTLYADYNRRPGYAGWSDTIPVQLTNAAHTNRLHFTAPVTDGIGTVNSVTAVSTKTSFFYKPGVGQRMEITISAIPDRHVYTVNGEPMTLFNGNGMPTVDFAELAQNDSMFLRRIALMPAAVDPYSVRTWRWSGTAGPAVVDTRLVAFDSELVNASLNRAPSVVILRDDGEEVDFAVFWFQKRSGTTFHAEMPGRLMQRNMRYTHSTRSIRAMTGEVVIYQHADWINGLGHNQDISVFRVPNGPYEGQLRAMFTHQDSVSGTLTGDNRSLYTFYNTSTTGDPLQWTTPVKIGDALATGSPYLIAMPASEPLIFPPDHPTCPNRTSYVVYDGTNTTMHLYYSDDFGGATNTNWTRGAGATYSGPATNINEATGCLWPDGTGIITFRCFNGAPQNMRVWAKTTDGATLTYQGLIPNWLGSEISAGTCQIDPSGVKFGTAYGKIVMVRSEYQSAIAGANNARCGLFMDFAKDATLEFRNPVYLFSRYRWSGYSSIKPILGNGEYAVIAHEFGSTGNGNFNIHTSVVQIPAAELVP